MLISLACEVNAVTLDECGIIQAALDGHADRLYAAAVECELLSQPPEDERSRYILGWALWAAAANDRHDAAKVLLELGADPDFLLDGQSTPLMIANRTGNQTFVRMVEEHRRNVSDDGRDEESATADCGLLAAAEEGDAEGIRQAAIACEHIGSDPKSEHSRKILGQALCTTVDFHHVAATFALFELGADPNFTDEKGKTPLSIAKRRGDRYMVLLLIDYGAAPQHTIRGDDDAETGPVRGPAEGEDFKEAKSRCKLSAGDVLGPLAVFLVGAGYLATGLTLQLATFDRQTDENPFRYVNYVILEAAFALGSIASIIAMAAAGSDPIVWLLPILLTTAAVTYGIMGVKYINTEGLYYFSTAAVSFLPIFFSVFYFYSVAF
jgi:hypothetical protein